MPDRQIVTYGELQQDTHRIIQVLIDNLLDAETENADNHNTEQI